MRLGIKVFPGDGFEIMYGRKIPLFSITVRRKLLHGAVVVANENAVLICPSIFDAAQSERHGGVTCVAFGYS